MLFCHKKQNKKQNKTKTKQNKKKALVFCSHNVISFPQNIFMNVLNFPQNTIWFPLNLFPFPQKYDCSCAEKNNDFSTDTIYCLDSTK